MKTITLLLIIIAITLSLFPIPVHATTFTIGYTSAGVGNGSFFNYMEIGNYSVTAAHSGIATSMTAYVSSRFSGTVHFKCALYSASGNFIASTEEGHISSTSPQWVTLDFTSIVYITAGTSYLLVEWGGYVTGTPGNYPLFYYNSIGGGNSARYSYTYVNGDNGWPSILSSSATSSPAVSLYLTYTESTIPSISISDIYPPTNISEVGATLWAYLNNDGGELCSTQFAYSGDGGFTYIFTTPTAYTSKTGDFVTSIIATGLTGNTTYYYKAYAINSQGNVSSGIPFAFTTYTTIGTPTNFTAVPLSNESSIKLNWVLGNGSASTMIRWKVGESPNAPDDTSSTLLCNTLFNSYTHRGLTAGDTIYYSAWGVSDIGNSTTYATTYATVSLGSDETTFTNPDLPTNWFIEVDYTKMSGVPFYGVINEVTDSFEINKQFMWGALGFMIGLMVFIASYRATQGNALSALLATTVILAVETGMGLMAGFMVFLFVIMSISLAFVHARP